eukprot:6369939-Pyramimonas_sp.AAC.1
MAHRGCMALSLDVQSFAASSSGRARGLSSSRYLVDGRRQQRRAYGSKSSVRIQCAGGSFGRQWHQRGDISHMSRRMTVQKLRAVQTGRDDSVQVDDESRAELQASAQKATEKVVFTDEGPRLNLSVYSCCIGAFLFGYHR